MPKITLVLLFAAFLFASPAFTHAAHALKNYNSSLSNTSERAAPEEGSETARTKDYNTTRSNPPLRRSVQSGANTDEAAAKEKRRYNLLRPFRSLSPKQEQTEQTQETRRRISPGRATDRREKRSVDETAKERAGEALRTTTEGARQKDAALDAAQEENARGKALRQNAADRRAELDGQAKKRGVEAQEKAEERRAEIREKIKERRKEIIRAFFSRMFTRLEAALDRLAILADRIKSRADKLEARGVRVTDARRALQNARDEIRQAREKLEETKVLADDVITGETPREAFRDMKTLIREGITIIKEARDALVLAFVALKANVKEETETAGNAQESGE